MSALWGVIIGGALTIVGTLSAELWKARVASQERTERRETTAREYRRQAATQLTDVAKAYRSALAENERTPRPTVTGEDRLRDTRAAFEAALFRVDSDDCRRKLEEWETAAVAWSQGEGPARPETQKWRAAMRSAGETARAQL